MSKKEETWETFLDTGMLWFVNRILHTLGWMIVLEYDSETEALIRAYPARTTLIGFDLATDTEKREVFLKHVGPMRVPAVTDPADLDAADQARLDRLASYTVDPE